MRVSLAAVFTMLWATAMVRPAVAADLIDVYRAAEQNDPRFQSALANYRAVRERLPQARAAILPNVGASGDVSRNDSRVRTDAGILSRPEGRARFDSTGYTLSLTQPVFNAAAFAALKQAGAEVRRAEADLASARLDLITRTASAYFGFLAAQDGVALAEAERQAIARQLETAEARLEVGLATITDVHDARARHELAQANLIETDNRLADQREALRELTGETPAGMARLKELPLTVPEPADPEKWISAASDQNLQLASARAAVEIARAEVERQRSGHYPTLDLVGSRNRNDSDASISGPGVRTDNDTIALELSVPIYQGGLVSSRTAEATARLRAAQEDLEASRRAVERATRSSYLGAASGAARVQALQQSVVASRSALEAKVEGFQAGINTNVDVLNAQRDLYGAERDLAQARYDYVLNLLRLKQSAGTLSEDDLRQANAWLDHP